MDSDDDEAAQRAYLSSRLAAGRSAPSASSAGASSSHARARGAAPARGAPSVKSEAIALDDDEYAGQAGFAKRDGATAGGGRGGRGGVRKRAAGTVSLDYDSDEGGAGASSSRVPYKSKEARGAWGCCLQWRVGLVNVARLHAGRAWGCAWRAVTKPQAENAECWSTGARREKGGCRTSPILYLSPTIHPLTLSQRRTRSLTRCWRRLSPPARLLRRARASGGDKTQARLRRRRSQSWRMSMRMTRLCALRLGSSVGRRRREETRSP